MPDDQECRLERLRHQVADQDAVSKRLRLDSKELRAAASALVDQTVALRLVARGLTKDLEPPIPTHPPAD